MWIRATAVLLGILLQGSFPTQTSEGLRQRYGKPISETFLVRPGIAVTATYGESSETCSLSIEPRQTFGTPVKPGPPFIEEKLLKEISEELVPEKDRGEYKTGAFLNILSSSANDSGPAIPALSGVQEDWANLVIIRISGEKGISSETITWTRAECGPVPGVH